MLYLPPTQHHRFFTNLPLLQNQPPRIMRGMIAYIPHSVNLTSTQGCIRGLAHACVWVCVEGKGEGDVRRSTCTSFCKLHFPQGYMEGFDDGGRGVGRILNPSFWDWPPLPGAWWGSGAYDKDFFLRMYLAYYIFKPTLIEEKFLKMKLGFFGP